MTFFHVADVHASKDRKQVVSQILDKLLENAKKYKPNYIIFSGDFWDCTITNTEASGFSSIIVKMRELSFYSKIVMIYGTPSHEPAGSLEVFADYCTVISDIKRLSFDDCDMVCIPEPRRSNFIADSEEKINIKINNYLSQLKKSEYKKNGKPLIVIYHGEIAGARFQNGIEASSPIALTKEILKNMKADYYACGHIHEPQAVFNGCWYAGSAYPIDMGETHDAGFNFITINDTTKIERISFGFTQNKTIDIEESLIPNLLGKDYTNFNLKIRITCKSKLNTHELKNQILKSTHASSVKIVVIMQKPTNIRSKEIINQKTVADKFRIYAKINNLNVNDSIYTKLKNLEDNMLIKYAFPSHSFELMEIELKGAKGLAASGKEKLHIDFSNYHDGIICLIGSNGSGKSTTLENCHPYPQMLTRSGKLRDHFYLHDSYRKLVYRDENGKLYRILISMAADIKTGVTKYYVETSDDGITWKPVNECDGNLDSYNKYIEETFGSLDIFLKTSFFAKEATKGYPDLAYATKGERMEIFAKLAGLDYYSTLYQMAKDNTKELSNQINLEEQLIEDKPMLLVKLSEYNTALINARQDFDGIEKEIADVKKILKDLRKKNESFHEYRQKQETLHSFASQLQASVDKNSKLIEDINNDLRNLNFLNENTANVKTLKSLKETLSIKKKNLDDLYPKKDKCHSELENVNSTLKELELKKAEITSNIKILENNLVAVSDVCPTCGAKLSEDKLHDINREVQENKKILQQNNESLKKIEIEISTSQSLTESIKNEIKKLDTTISCCKDDIALFTDSINNLSNFEAFINFIPKYSDHEKLIKKLSDENEAIINKLNICVGSEIPEDVTDTLRDYENKLDELSQKYTEILSRIKASEASIASISDSLSKITKTENSIKLKKTDLEELQILTKALSNTGIQALELEAALPEITEIANNILHNSYGEKFTIGFDTLREGSKGLVEDFNIVITNNITGFTSPMAMLSSGELVWIKQALYYAFSIIRSNATGFSFKTRFMDESDGSLDSDMRVKYMKMIEAAHIAGSANKTILITHSQEIKDVAEQIITL